MTAKYSHHIQVTDLMWSSTVEAYLQASLQPTSNPSEYKILLLRILNAAGITKVYTSKYNSVFSNFCSSFFLTQQQTSCDKLWELH